MHTGPLLCPARLPVCTTLCPGLTATRPTGSRPVGTACAAIPQLSGSSILLCFGCRTEVARQAELARPFARELPLAVAALAPASVWIEGVRVAARLPHHHGARRQVASASPRTTDTWNGRTTPVHKRRRLSFSLTLCLSFGNCRYERRLLLLLDGGDPHELEDSPISLHLCLTERTLVVCGDRLCSIVLDKTSLRVRGYGGRLAIGVSRGEESCRAENGEEHDCQGNSDTTDPHPASAFCRGRGMGRVRPSFLRHASHQAMG